MAQRANGIVGLAATLKRSLPSPIVSVLRVIWHQVEKLRSWWPDVQLYLSLAFYRLQGKSYLRWYADMLDSWAKAGRDEVSLEQRRAKISDNGREDLEILIASGLKPHNTLHEYGVGQLRSAKWFIEYLDAGKFSGNDSSGERIQNGLDLFGDTLRPKQPTFMVNQDNSLDWMQGRKADFIWCHAVIGHMPKADVEDLIVNIRKVMTADSMFLFTHDEPEHLPSGWLHERMDSRNFWYSFAFFQALADKHGYQIENVSHLLADKPSYRSYFRLAKLTLKPV